MKRSVAFGTVLALSIGIPLAAGSAPYEDQKMQIQRVQQAKLRAMKTPEVPCADMQQHMPLMQQMRQQMSQAGAVDQMTPEQMRNWINDHAALMERMHGQMLRQ